MIQVTNYSSSGTLAGVDPVDACAPDHGPLQRLPAGVADRLGLLISKIASEMLVRASGPLRELGIDGRDYALLAVLSKDAPGSQAELAELCSLLPAQLVPVLDALEAAGLVERQRDERDRRRFIVRITDDGRATLAAADTVARQVEESLLGELAGDIHERLAATFSAALPAQAVAGPAA